MTPNEFDKRSSRVFIAMASLHILALVVWLAASVVVAYAAIHFVCKWW